MRRVQFRANHNASSQTLEEQVDANEDREILGAYALYSGNDGVGDKNGFLHLGSLNRAASVNGEANMVDGDIGVIFFNYAENSLQSDNTGTGGGQNGNQIWFGDEGAIAWDEDVTMTFNSATGGNDSGDGDLSVIVYYRRV